MSLEDEANKLLREVHFCERLLIFLSGPTSYGYSGESIILTEEGEIVQKLPFGGGVGWITNQKIIVRKIEDTKPAKNFDRDDVFYAIDVTNNCTRKTQDIMLPEHSLLTPEQEFFRNHSSHDTEYIELPSCFPKKNALAYILQRMPPAYQLIQPAPSARTLVSVIDGKKQVIEHLSPSSGFRWSPDGGLIYLSASGQYRWSDPHGLIRRSLPFLPGRDQSMITTDEHTHYITSLLSSNQRKKDPKSLIDNDRIYLIESKFGIETELASWKNEEGIATFLTPPWILEQSPNQQWFIVSSYRINDEHCYQECHLINKHRGIVSSFHAETFCFGGEYAFILRENQLFRLELSTLETTTLPTPGFTIPHQPIIRCNQ